MKCYLIDNLQITQATAQLFQLRADCSRLQWSTLCTPLPAAVTDSIDTLESYIDEQLDKFCHSGIETAILSDDDEVALLHAINQSNILKETLGKGVCYANADRKSIISELEKYNCPNTIVNALAGSSNLVIL